METSLVLQDPAFTGLGGRAPAAAGSGDASALFASTLQQELSVPCSGNEETLAALPSMPRSLRSESGEWWRSPLSVVSLPAAPQPGVVNAAATSAPADNPQATSLLILPGSSTTFNPLPDATEAEEPATLTTGAGVVLTAPAAAAAPPVTTVPEVPPHKNQPATGTGPALTDSIAAAAPRHEARTSGSKRGLEHKQESLSELLPQQAPAAPAAADKVAEPLASSPLQEKPADAQSSMTPATLPEGLDQPAAAAVPATDRQAPAAPMPSTLAEPRPVANASGNLDSIPARPSFAPAISMPRVSGPTANPSDNAAMLPNGEAPLALTTPLNQSGRAPANGVTMSAWQEAGERPLNTRQLTARTTMSFMQDGPADNIHRFVVPQTVLAPEPDASIMQQALALAALRQNDAAAAAAESRSTTDALPFSLQTETPVGTEGWGEEIGHHISWLSEQKIGKAELTLHPAELGALDITINNEEDRVTITIVTRNEAARELLQDNLPRLAELLRHNGLTLEQGSVSQQGAGRQDAPSAHGGAGATANDGKDVAGSDVPRPRSALLHHGQIDHYV